MFLTLLFLSFTYKYESFAAAEEEPGSEEPKKECSAIVAELVKRTEASVDEMRHDIEQLEVRVQLGETGRQALLETINDLRHEMVNTEHRMNGQIAQMGVKVDNMVCFLLSYCILFIVIIIRDHSLCINSIKLL